MSCAGAVAGLNKGTVRECFLAGTGAVRACGGSAAEGSDTGGDAGDGQDTGEDNSED